jgi:hypothetical protein
VSTRITTIAPVRIVHRACPISPYCPHDTVLSQRRGTLPAGVKDVDGWVQRRLFESRELKGAIQMTSSTTTTGPRSALQYWLEFLASNRSAADRDAPVEAPTYAAAVQGREGVGGWDPHEVWLDRIKRPRDEHRAASLAPAAETAAVDYDVKKSP